jgi:hypothetical protein
MTTTTVRLIDFLTPRQIRQVEGLWNTSPRSEFHKRVMKEVVTPNMKEINQKLKQENDPAYLAYAIEYVLGRVKG